MSLPISIGAGYRVHDCESLGVLVADVTGLFLQSCLYQVHLLDGAVVQCPV